MAGLPSRRPWGGAGRGRGDRQPPFTRGVAPAPDTPQAKPRVRGTGPLDAGAFERWITPRIPLRCPPLARRRRVARRVDEDDPGGSDDQAEVDVPGRGALGGARDDRVARLERVPGRFVRQRELLLRRER